MTRRQRSRRAPRRGVVAVLAVMLLTVMLGFVAFTIDTGNIALTRAKMQNACDGAALAASQEIVAAVYSAGEGQGQAGDVNSIAIAAAKATAEEIAAANGVYIDPEQDVVFGKRTFSEATNDWSIEWGGEPANVVKVNARRDQDDTNLPDGRVKSIFAWALGVDSTKLSTESIAFVEARDLVVVLDYSGSMNDDSELRSIYKIPQSDIEANLLTIYQELGSPNLGTLPWMPDGVTVKGQEAAGPIPHISVKFSLTEINVASTKDLSNVVLRYGNGNEQKFDNLDENPSLTGTFSGTGSNSGKKIVRAWIKSGSNSSGDGPGYGERFDYPSDSEIETAFGLDEVEYPYPSGSWDSYIDYVQSSGYIKDAGYRNLYGGLTWVNYLLQHKPRYSQTPDLWKTQHFPFHGMKDGMSLFLDFLDDLDFGDYVGFVTYGTSAQREEGLVMPDEGIDIDLAGVLITNDYAAIDTIQRHKQAGHYSTTTALGDGVKVGTELLLEQTRYGARPTMLVMTDGNANVKPAGWSLPADWDWDAITDYDSDGEADYVTSDSKKQYAFWEIKQAIDAGITVHTLTVGYGADTDLMEAIAFAGGGIWVHVPGSSSVAEMEADLLAAFQKIAGNVPPAKLVNSGN
jgi:Flp pilus assembly protein TadG